MNTAHKEIIRILCKNKPSIYVEARIRALYNAAEATYKSRDTDLTADSNVHVQVQDGQAIALDRSSGVFVMLTGENMNLWVGEVGVSEKDGAARFWGS